MSDWFDKATESDLDNISIEDDYEKSWYDFVLWDIVDLHYPTGTMPNDISKTIKLYNRTLENIFQMNKGIKRFVIYVECLDEKHHQETNWSVLPLKTSIGFDWNSKQISDVISLYSSIRTAQLKFTYIRELDWLISPRYLELIHRNKEKILKEETMNLKHFNVNIDSFCKVLNIEEQYNPKKLQFCYKDINEKIKSLIKNKKVLMP